jgi:aconitate hydratase
MIKFNPLKTDFLTLKNGSRLAIVDLPTVFGENLDRLPVVLRVLLENVIRNMQGAERDDAVQSILGWLETGSSNAEIAFQPNRVLMHDTTSTPALVDIAAMRDELSEQGVDPKRLNPVLPVDISIDHSLAVESFAKSNSAQSNLELEIKRNKERYGFLQWASKALTGVRINPPGTGIMHTINLEQLATVVTTQIRDGVNWAVPDTMIGTDSHTPMINGIGVLGWGVGGLEAQTVMFGLPTMLKVPDVIGVKLTGSLPSGVSSTDLALTVTEQLRKLDVTGDFVEFYGPGVSALTAGDRAVVANMAPEYGATTGFFPVDDQTLKYLRDTGRSNDAVELVEQYCRHTHLWFDPQNTPRYTKEIQIDLSALEPSIAGPRRPQDRMAYSKITSSLEGVNFVPEKSDAVMPKHPVAIAAITSCTNTSDPHLLIAAGLVAKKARQYGLKPPAWVKTSLAPGSPAATSYLKRAGLLDDLSAVGFGIVGYGCTTCIGNSGPLTDLISQAQSDKVAKAVAILSGNRNFPGRVHPEIDLSFIMSPALVVAFGLAGNAQIDLSKDPIGIGNSGEKVYLSDLMPHADEVTEYVNKGLDAKDFRKDFALATQNPMWHSIAVESTPLFSWDPKSTALRRPPFAAISEGSLLGHYTAFPLLVVGDDITTDHISPASAIPKDSFIADYLVGCGDDRNDLNVFASRRGNWEVMMRAAFFNKSLVNRLGENIPVGHTLHIPSGDVMPIWEVAKRYKDEDCSAVIIAGERYGMGSSRDWAAKGQRLLGVKAVIAVSYERIHRSNLIGMGILPIVLPAGMNPDSLNIQPGDTITIDASPEKLKVRGKIPIQIQRIGGGADRFEAQVAVETMIEVELLKYGGVIPSILQKNIQQ